MATLLLTLIIIAALFYLFYKLKTPYYRVDRQRMIQTLELVLTGQATENDWQMTFAMVIRHSPELEVIRQQCVDIEDQCYIGEQKPPHLFAEDGLARLRFILEELKNNKEPE